ncbi:dTMP kinase [Brevibacterium ravenspurgense]|uniref:dTMP kinase n=1 Tax=Brevibacterium ravenspurgense TaxID=479117 RepID=UPI0002D2CD26|nr:dTMP kinase [Brevibacterium ravenspurgense]
MSNDKRLSAKQSFGGPNADTSDRIAAITPQRGVIGHAVLEAATWLAVMSSVLLTYSLAGVVGFASSARGGALAVVVQREADGDFNRNFANPAYLAVIVLLGIGSFLPLKRVRSMEFSQRTLILTITSVLTGITLIVFGVYSTVWMGAIAALFLGALISLQVIHTPELHTKPWRAGTVSAVIFFFIGAVAQIRAGIGAGMPAVPWTVFASGIVIILAGVLIIVSPLQRSRIPSTGAFPLTRALRQARAHVDVGTPWPVYALFGVIGSIFVVIVPTASDESFGIMSLGLMVCAVLVGWAAGYEAGPTFAPGMARPRLTAFSLIGAGVLAILGGMVHEVSGTALLFAAAAFAVGVGVRAQDYQVSRRIGLGIGAIITLLILSLDARFKVVLSEASTWNITGSAVAVSSVGLLATVGGIIALFLFSPTGIHGIGVDIVHAFRTRKADGHPGQSAGPTGAHSPNAPHAPAMPAGHGEQAVQSGGGLRAPAVRTAQSGFFIAVEGPDGSGKTTQIDFIRKHLAARGLHNVETTREPGGTDKGKQIRAAILDGQGVTPKSEALLYAADRSHHVASLIGPTLRSGGVVVTDRYIDSSLAYQAAGRELAEEDIFALSAWGTDGLMPNLTLLLDISPEASAQRTSQRGNENHLDKQTAEFRGRVRARFLSLAEENPHRYVVINADQPAQKVSEDIAAALDAALDAAGLGRRPQAQQPGSQTQRRSSADLLTSDDPDATQAMPPLEAENARAESEQRSKGEPSQSASAQGPAVSQMPVVKPAEEQQKAADGSQEASEGQKPADVQSKPAKEQQESAEPEHVETAAGSAESADTAADSDSSVPPKPEAKPAPVPEADTILPDTPSVSADDDAATRLLPSQPEQSAEKLRKQAEIERQARERLRQARRGKR